MRNARTPNDPAPPRKHPLKRTALRSVSSKRAESGKPSLKRGGRLRVRNPEKAKKRRAEDRVYGSYHRYVTTLSCWVAEHSPSRHVCEVGDPIDGHHVISVGAGGEDAANVVPLCRRLHTASPAVSVHSMGKQSFDEFWGVNLESAAVLIWARFHSQAAEAA